MFHGQSDVIGGDGEKVLDLRVSTQLVMMCLHKAAQGPVTHKLHDQQEGLCKYNQQVNVMILLKQVLF